MVEQAPELFTTAPAIAIPIAVSNSGLKASDIDFYEINEAFSVSIIVSFRLMRPSLYDPCFTC